uniref:hypothetical protein n=1 Tax=Vibrio sonorensis TaxID=1004316 RepID=UPI001586024F
PDTGNPVDPAEHGQLVIDPDTGEGEIEPLDVPPVIIDENGFLVDLNTGEQVTTPDDEPVKPIIDEQGNVLVSPDGNVIVDIYSPDGSTDTGNNGTVSFDESGEA